MLEQCFGVCLKLSSSFSIFESVLFQIFTTQPSIQNASIHSLHIPKLKVLLCEWGKYVRKIVCQSYCIFFLGLISYTLTLFSLFRLPTPPSTILPVPGMHVPIYTHASTSHSEIWKIICRNHFHLAVAKSTKLYSYYIHILCLPS